MDISTTVEDKLKRRKPLRLKGILKKRPETLEEFLIRFFNSFNENNNTVYVESGNVQTDTGRRRSFGDILIICRYYYPECTVKEVKDILINELPHKVDNFRCSYCSTINKRVYYKGTEDQDAEFHDWEDEDEFGLTGDDWEDL